MIDLERELRQVLEEDARGAPPPADASDTLRRARGRQFRVLAIASVVALVIVVGATAGVTGALRSSGPVPSGPGPSPSVAPAPEGLQLVGTWRSGSTSLTLRPCAVGEKCGVFEKIDFDHPAIHCSYTLTYVSQEARSITFKSRMISGTNQSQNFHCGWSPWEGNTVDLIPRAGGTVQIQVLGGNAGNRSAFVLRPG